MVEASRKSCSLALETSGRRGEVALGRGQTLLGIAQVPVPPRGRVHRVDLMLVVDALCKQHGVAPADLGEVYVSIGPGSFTGLRNAVTTAKMLAMTLGARIVAVPTTDVVVGNVPLDATMIPGVPGVAGTNVLPGTAVMPMIPGVATATGVPEIPAGTGGEYVAVCLNAKGESVYAALYRRTDDHWQRVGEPRTVPLSELLAQAPRPLAVVGDHLPLVTFPAGVALLDEVFAAPHAQAVWRLGQAMAKAGQFTEAMNLLPLYARPPEAVELWNAKK